MAKNIGHVLYSHWQSQYKEKHGVTPEGSRFRDAAMMKQVADDLGESTVRDLIDYYIDHKSNHSFTHFIFNYDSLLREKRLRERDHARVQLAQRRTAERLKELGVELGNETTDSDLQE